MVLFLALTIGISNLLQMTSRTKLTRKQVDDVLGGDETWKHADSTAGRSFTWSPSLHT